MPAQLTAGINFYGHIGICKVDFIGAVHDPACHSLEITILIFDMTMFDLISPDVLDCIRFLTLTRFIAACIDALIGVTCFVLSD